MNSFSAITGIERRKISASAFRTGGAHGDDKGWNAAGRGTSNALVRTGGEKGEELAGGGKLPTPDNGVALPADGRFSPGGFVFRPGAGQVEAGPAAIFRNGTVADGWDSEAGLIFSDGVVIDGRRGWR